MQNARQFHDPVRDCQLYEVHEYTAKLFEGTEAITTTSAAMEVERKRKPVAKASASCKAPRTAAAPREGKLSAAQLQRLQRMAESTRRSLATLSDLSEAVKAETVRALVPKHAADEANMVAHELMEHAASIELEVVNKTGHCAQHSKKTRLLLEKAAEATTTLKVMLKSAEAALEKGGSEQ